MWKDKSRRNIGVDEFQLTSKKFIIHPEYSAKEGAETHDICLIRTPENEFGIFEDLSPKFETIPCLPETFDLEMVKTNFKNSSLTFKLQFHGKSCWVAGWGQSQTNGISSDSLKSIGVNLFNHQYCRNHRFVFRDLLILDFVKLFVNAI